MNTLIWTPHPDGSETAEACGFKYVLYEHPDNKPGDDYWFVYIEWERLPDSHSCSDIGRKNEGRAFCQSHHDAIRKAIVDDPVRKQLVKALAACKRTASPIAWGKAEAALTAAKEQETN